MAKQFVLYDYWRSSASYRVRIALYLLGIEPELRPVNLLSGDHRTADYISLNPQGLLPTLEIDGKCFTQSLAIIEYLHATTPGSTLLPSAPEDQFRVRQLAYAIAMEIHPVCNLSVVSHATRFADNRDLAKREWMQHFISKGLNAFETLLAANKGPFCFGAHPTMADCCLMPQLYNAARWGVETSGLGRIQEAAAAANALPAFRAAHPDQVGAPPEPTD